MNRVRFSKAAALKALDARSDQLAQQWKFNRSHGTAQLAGDEGDIARAVAYGRMRAFEDFACAIEEGFAFEPINAGESPMEPT